MKGYRSSDGGKGLSWVRGKRCAVVNKHNPPPRIDITQNPRGRRRREQCADTLHLRKTEWRGVVGFKVTGGQVRASVASSLQLDTGMVTRVEF